MISQFTFELQRFSTVIHTVKDGEVYFVENDTFSTVKGGLVPAPASSDPDLFLTAAGTWDTAGGGGAAIGNIAVLDTVASTVEGAMWIVT